MARKTESLHIVYIVVVGRKINKKLNKNDNSSYYYLLTRKEGGGTYLRLRLAAY